MDKKNSDDMDNPYVLTVSSKKLDNLVTKPIYDYFNGFNQKNADIILSSFTPTILINKMKEKGIYENEVSRTENNIKLTYEIWEENYGENPSIEFIEEVYNKQLTKEYLELAKKYFEMTYYDIYSEIEIEYGYEISYKYKITGDKNSEENTETACLVHIMDDDWKIIFCSSEMLLPYVNVSNKNISETSENSETESE